MNLLFGRAAAYAAFMVAAFHSRVVLFEAPTLAVSFGDAWIAYQRRVRRWLGRKRQ